MDLQNHVLILVAVGCRFPLKSRKNTERSAIKEKPEKELEKYWKGGVDITLNKLSNERQQNLTGQSKDVVDQL